MGGFIGRLPRAERTEELPGKGLGDRGWTPAPLVLQWITTTRCNLRCPHCLTGGDGPGVDSTDRLTRRLVTQAAAAGVEQILITGGEPLIWPGLVSAISEMKAAGMRWSLNTAIAPTPEQVRAMEEWPPDLVAVSLDGPEAVHDGFRGSRGSFEQALRGIGIYKTLPGCHVTAGTTVTSRNHGRLGRTLALVAESGADSWGLHLLLPEGRARGNKELALSQAQVRQLIDFVIQKRSYFPISLADELGFCGELEPLIRNVPLGCGAGRAMAVVLPGGEIVPCTTLDTRWSQGNLHDRDLLDIWTNGFKEIRAWRPEGECLDCNYQAPCRGGCWLSRIRGAGCYKEAWEPAPGMRTAAGLALCLGLAAGSGTAGARSPADPQEQKASVESSSDPSEPEEKLFAPQGPRGIDAQILSWYSSMLPRKRAAAGPYLPAAPKKPACTAPDANELLCLMAGPGLPGEVSARLELIRRTIKDHPPSMALAALSWRCLVETALDRPELFQDQALAAGFLATTQALARTATSWRAAIFQGRLDPYLVRDRLPLRYRFEMSKAYHPTPVWLDLLRDQDQERWGTPDSAPLEQDFLRAYPWAKELDLLLSTPEKVEIQRGLPRQEAPDRLGILDTLTWGAPGEHLTLKLGGPGLEVKVKIPGGRPITWPELLSLAATQQEQQLETLAASRPTSDEATQNPLLLPHYRKARQSPEPSDQGRALHWLVDFWMF